MPSTSQKMVSIPLLIPPYPGFINPPILIPCLRLLCSACRVWLLIVSFPSGSVREVPLTAFGMYELGWVAPVPYLVWSEGACMLVAMEIEAEEAGDPVLPTLFGGAGGMMHAQIVFHALPMDSVLSLPVWYPSFLSTPHSSL